MIGFMRGTLVAKTLPQIIMDVQGVGYELEVPVTTFYALPALGQPLKLYTHLVIREDAHKLFAFATEADQSMFRALIKVNGVGPKLALTVLSGQSAQEFHHCIDNNDVQALIRLPGVGKKTAERLLVEMRDRLPTNTNDSTALQQPAHNPKQEAVSALCTLGYKAPDASRMVNNVPSDAKSCEDIIRLALQGVSKR